VHIYIQCWSLGLCDIYLWPPTCLLSLRPIAFPAATSFSTGSLTALGLYFIYFPTNTIEQLIRVHSNLLQGFKLNDVWLRGFVTVFSTLFSFDQ